MIRAELILLFLPMEQLNPPKMGWLATIGRRKAEVTQFAAMEETGRSETIAGRAVEIIVISSAAQKAISMRATKIIQNRRSFGTFPCSEACSEEEVVEEASGVEGRQ